MTIGLDQAFASCFLTLVRIFDWKLAITSCKCFPSNIDVTKQIAKSGSIKPLWLQWRQESGEYRRWRKLTAKAVVKEIFLSFSFSNLLQFQKTVAHRNSINCILIFIWTSRPITINKYGCDICAYYRDVGKKSEYLISWV